jgi:shikimate dehydrogenase
LGIPYAEVIGDPIAHSKSPLIHNFWLRRLGLEGEYHVVRVPAADDGVQVYLAGAIGDDDWLGCNVTAPHKRAIMPHLDRLSPEAAGIGAVNIVARAGVELIGHNSDGRGFLEPLRPLLMQPHLFRMARLLGAGGAARAIAHALVGEGFTLVVASREVAAAEALLADIEGEHHAVPLSYFAQPTDFVFDDRKGLLDLVINATPLGMHGQQPLALDWSHVPPASIIYDVVYAPIDTPLLTEARERGHQTLDGLHMLIGQAAIAFELFFGQPAPRQYDAELRELLTR